MRKINEMIGDIVDAETPETRDVAWNKLTDFITGLKKRCAKLENDRNTLIATLEGLRHE